MTATEWFEVIKGRVATFNAALEAAGENEQEVGRAHETMARCAIADIGRIEVRSGWVELEAARGVNLQVVESTVEALLWLKNGELAARARSLRCERCPDHRFEVVAVEKRLDDDTTDEMPVPGDLVVIADVYANAVLIGTGVLTPRWPEKE